MQYLVSYSFMINTPVCFIGNIFSEGLYKVKTYACIPSLTHLNIFKKYFQTIQLNASNELFSRYLHLTKRTGKFLHKVLQYISERIRQISVYILELFAKLL